MLLFKPATHEYTVDGARVPSVTEVLRAAGLEPDLSTVSPAVLEAARARGVAVHALCAALDRGEPDPFVAPPYRGYATAYERFLNEAKYHAEYTEVPVHHPTLHYAGTPDMIGWIGPTRCVIDRKTSVTIHHRSVAIQCAAYRGAHNAAHPEQPAEAILALHLRKDGTYRLKYYDIDYTWRVWTAALCLWQHKQTRHRDRRPEEIL